MTPAIVHLYQHPLIHLIPTQVDNWEQLRKFFRKQRIEVPAILIDNTIHCKLGAANLLLQVQVKYIYDYVTRANIKARRVGHSKRKKEQKKERRGTSVR